MKEITTKANIVSNININSFLLLGYFIEYNNDKYKLDYSSIDKTKYLNYSEEELIDIGIKKFLGVINENFIPGRKHVVPLSGGLDSRAILGGLLEFTEAKNIYTYTFGTSGTYDYDIGNLVAKKIGTNHVSFPLAEYQYNMDEMIDIAKRVDFQTILFHHPPVWEVDKQFSDGIIWSGYVGDAVVGGHLKKHPSRTLSEAKKRYLNSRAVVKSINLTNCDLTYFFDYFSCQCVDMNNLSLDEQILFDEGCQKIAAPHVLMKGYKYLTPFINNSWMDFMLSIDNKYRFNQYLYKKIILKTFPKLFSLKIKSNYGLPLNASNSLIFLNKVITKSKRICNRYNPLFNNPHLNYIDFDNAIRTRTDLRKIVYENIMELKSRKIVEWINIDEIWKHHINQQANHGIALIALTSLEIILIAQGK